MIVLQNVSKRFQLKDRTVDAVQDVSITIADKEIYGIIGFSGAGKSTLVRCINMLERPTSGSVQVNGVEMTELSGAALREQRRRIGMIFQQFNLMPSRTVFGNIALPLESSGLSKEEIRARVERLLSFVELSERAEAYPSQLSGGQKQRVAIARALATDPDILLCDEATSALDPQTTNSILALISRLNVELGITVVIITHEMQVIKKVCHRVAVMEHGKVVEEGKVYEVFSQPQQKITRDFIDTTSNLSSIYELIEAKNPLVQPAGDEMLVRLQYQSTTVAEPLLSVVSQQYGVTVNILFSDIELVEGRPIGGTVSMLKGERSSLEGALDYLRERRVKVEVITDGNA